MGQVTPKGAMTDTQGATSSIGGRGGPWGLNISDTNLSYRKAKLVTPSFSAKCAKVVSNMEIYTVSSHSK